MSALPNDRVVQAQVRVDLPPIPEDRHIQHHPLFCLKLPVLQLPQGLQLSGLQFRYKAQPTHVNAQHRHFVQRCQLGQVKNRAVSSERDQQIRAPQLLG